MRSIISMLLLCTSCGGSSLGTLEDLANDAAACETAEDCCVVMDDCHRRAYVVGSADYEHARDLSRSAAQEPPGCNRFCELPTVELQCVTGKCAGVVARADMPHLRTDHCGTALLDETAGRNDVVLECVPITTEHNP